MFLSGRRSTNRLAKEALQTFGALLISYVILSHTSFLHHAKNTVQDVYDHHVNSTSGRKQFVILLAGSRTGSNFLAQLFNQNPNFLYIHEPFSVRHLLDLREYERIPEADERSTLDELQIFWLRQVLDRCDTGDLQLRPQLERFGRCGLEGENLVRFGHKHCNETFSENSRSELCIMRNTVVMKISRLLQLNWLNYIQDAFVGHDIKIIHLLRDPRDVIASRFKFKHYYYKDRFPITHTVNMEHKVSLAAEEWCLRELDTLLFAEREPPTWLRNNYRLIRFEELIDNPKAIARELYDFIGYETIPDTVQSWLRNQGNGKVDYLAEAAEYPSDRWNSTMTAAVEYECKPLIIKMGLQFKELDIQYSESYY